MYILKPVEWKELSKCQVSKTGLCETRSDYYVMMPNRTWQCWPLLGYIMVYPSK